MTNPYHHRCIRCSYGWCSPMETICTQCHKIFFGHPTWYSYVPEGDDLLYADGSKDPKRNDIVCLVKKTKNLSKGTLLVVSGEWIKGLLSARDPKDSNRTIIYPREATLVMREDGSHDKDLKNGTEIQNLRLALWNGKMDPARFNFSSGNSGQYDVRSSTLMPQIRFKRRKDEVVLSISFPTYALETSNSYKNEKEAVIGAKEFLREMSGDLNNLLT